MILEYLRPYLLTFAKIGVILAAAYLTAVVFGRVIRGVRGYLLRRVTDGEREKQAATFAAILGTISKLIIFAAALVMVLRELGFDVVPIVAGASVAGLAIGFGAQSLVKDVIAGFFLLVENQIRVNDVVVINDIGGVVEEMNLRTTILRDIEGAVHVFPNGSIAKLCNKTHDFSYYVFNLSISYRDDVYKVVDILRSVAADLAAEEMYRASVLAPIEVMGVDQLGEASVTVKARIKTAPGKQWDVGREMNSRLKLRFEQAGLEFPVKGPKKLELVSPGTTREELKIVIEEVLEERDGERPRHV